MLHNPRAVCPGYDVLCLVVCLVVYLVCVVVGGLALLIIKNIKHATPAPAGLRSLVKMGGKWQIVRGGVSGWTHARASEQSIAGTGWQCYRTGVGVV